MSVRKVAMVLNTLGSGGIPEAVLNHCTHLPRDRDQPLLFVLKAGPADPGLRARFAAAEVPVTVACGCDVKIGTVAELAERQARSGVDFLHSHSFRRNLNARLAGSLCRPTGLRILAHDHNQRDDKWPAGSAALTLERQLAQVTAGAVRLVPVGDPDALAAAIAGFDAVARQAASRAGPVRARAFDWATAAARLAGLYDGLPWP